MTVILLHSIVALILFSSATPADAESILFQIEEFEGELLWWRSYDGPDSYTEYGGPKTVTLELPGGVQSVQSVRVALAGEWSDGCVDGESYGECWVPTLYLSGGCVDMQVNPGVEGFTGFDRAFTDCDSESLIDQEILLTIWTDRFDTNPTTSGSGIPSVHLHGINVTYDVNEAVDGAGDSWSVLKSRY